MTVTEFTKLDATGTMYKVVDADKVGYRTNPTILIDADKNVIREIYGNRIVVGFEIVSKKSMMLYTKEK